MRYQEYTDLRHTGSNKKSSPSEKEEFLETEVPAVINQYACIQSLSKILYLV